MTSYRLFKLYRSETDTTGPLWRDLGSVPLDLEGDLAATVGEQFGKGEFLVMDENLTVVDFEVT